MARTSNLPFDPCTSLTRENVSWQNLRRQTSNLPVPGCVPQVWIGNWYRSSISELVPPRTDSNFIPPTGGSPLFLTSPESEPYYSVVMPGPATFTGLAAYRIHTQVSEQPPFFADIVFRVNGIDRAILEGDAVFTGMSVKVNKGDQVSVQLRNIVGSLLLSVALVFVPSVPSNFYYAGGTGLVNITTTEPFWNKRPAFQWRDFCLADLFQSESNTPMHFRSVVPINCVLKSCIVRIWGNNTLGEPPGFVGTCNVRLVKGRGASEEVLGEGQIINNGEVEITDINARLFPGDLVSFHLQVVDYPGSGSFPPNQSRPGLYYSTVVESLDRGWFMLGNGHQFEPSEIGREYPITDGEEETSFQTTSDHPFRSIIPVNMTLKNWHLAINEFDRGPATYQLYNNSLPESLAITIANGVLAYSDLQNQVFLRRGDLVNYMAQGDVNFHSEGFTHSLAAKVLLPQ